MWAVGSNATFSRYFARFIGTHEGLLAKEINNRVKKSNAFLLSHNPFYRALSPKPMLLAPIKRSNASLIIKYPTSQRNQPLKLFAIFRFSL